MRFQSSDIPQANRLDLLVHLVKRSTVEGLSPDAIVVLLQNFTGGSYTRRQALYYGDAAAILGLFVRLEDKYLLTRIGKKLARCQNHQEESETLRNALNEVPLIRELKKFLSQNKNLDRPTAIEKFLVENSTLSLSTARRRTSTLIRYLEYA